MDAFLKNKLEFNTPEEGVTESGGLKQNFAFELVNPEDKNLTKEYKIWAKYSFKDFPKDWLELSLTLKGTCSTTVSQRNILQAVFDTLNAEVDFVFYFNEQKETGNKVINKQNSSLSYCLSRREDGLSHEIFKAYKDGLEKYDVNVVMSIVKALKMKYKIDPEAGKRIEKPQIVRPQPVPKKEESKPQPKPSFDPRPLDLFALDGKVLREETKIYSREHRS